MTIGNQTVNEFLEVLSSKQPVPGGGGASALAGALGTALGLMVGNLTVGKKKYAQVEGQVTAMMEQLSFMQKEMVRLADEDARVFAPLAAAYGLPAATEEEKAHKDRVMEENLLQASLVPLEIMELAVKVLDILKELEEKGSVMAVSDVGVAVQFTRTALTGAVMNVWINTKSMKNRQKALEINERAQALTKQGTALADEIYDKVLERLKGKQESTTVTLKGAQVSAGIKEEVQKIRERSGSGTPKLAIVRVGERPDDLSYERGAMKKMASFGLEAQSFPFPEDISNEAFQEEFRKINEDPEVDGILVLRPLPRQISEKDIENMINPDKDLDGISPVNIAKVFAGDTTGFAPCTAEAVVEVLKANHIPMTGKRAVIVGRSMVVGKPLAMLLMKENATVTVCHTRTADLPGTCRNGEILVAAAGRARMLNSDYVGQGAVVIDVGINVDEDGKLCGDVDFDSIQNKASMATPVPGGVGAVTTAVLARHLALAAERRRG